MKANKQTMLLIMDGFGIPTHPERSAITEQNTKCLQALCQKFPHTTLAASGPAVGLPEGQAGTSDVGHLTIGTGRVNDQPLVRVDKAISTGIFFQNKVLLQAMKRAKQKNTTLHLLGLPTDGGVHGHIRHLFALLDMAKQQNVPHVVLHIFADGRDVPPKSMQTYIHAIQDKIAQVGVGTIATVMGRFYALDRDNNWDRLQIAIEAMVQGKGVRCDDIDKAIMEQYAQNITDEFLKPMICTHNEKDFIHANDEVIIYNYRSDRERQLSKALMHAKELHVLQQNIGCVVTTMMNYDIEQTDVHVAFEPLNTKNTLAEVLSNRGYTQLKVAETEKYAYVTFAMNAGRKEAFLNEERILVRSEKLPKYDVLPHMGAYEITKQVLQALKEKEYDVIIINFANCDMVGHSGNKQAAWEAVKVVDECVHTLTEYMLNKHARVLITADHGNSDEMVYENGSPNTAHTTALVPFILVDEDCKSCVLRKGTLADVAPTLLDCLNEEKPKEMTGASLIVH